MTEMAIEAEGLVKTYPKGVRALDGVSFGVAAGSVFGLVGPNGAGKSTTVKILTTLSRPDSGAAEVAGIDVLRRPDDVRRAIGCVAQKSGVDVHASGRENMLKQTSVKIRGCGEKTGGMNVACSDCVLYLLAASARLTVMLTGRTAGQRTWYRKFSCSTPTTEGARRSRQKISYWFSLSMRASERTSSDS